MDENKEFKAALGARTLGLSGLVTPSFFSRVRRAQAKYPTMDHDLKGDGTGAGGLLVVRPDGTVPFFHLEKAFGDFSGPEGLPALRPFLLEYPPTEDPSPKPPKGADAADGELHGSA